MRGGQAPKSVAIDKSGAVYEGDLDGNGKYNGHGKLSDADGNVYTGEVTGGEGGEGRIIRKFIKQ